MSNTNPQPTTSMPDWYDPYPEPNTMPRKWDLSQYGYTDERRRQVGQARRISKTRRRRNRDITRPDQISGDTKALAAPGG